MKAIAKDADWLDRLRGSVEASGKSLRALSLEAGLSHGYVFSLLAGKRAPTVPHLRMLCQALGVSVGEIVDGRKTSPEQDELLEAWSNLSRERRAALLLILSNERKNK